MGLRISPFDFFGFFKDNECGYDANYHVLYDSSYLDSSNPVYMQPTAFLFSEGRRQSPSIKSKWVLSSHPSLSTQGFCFKHPFLPVFSTSPFLLAPGYSITFCKGKKRKKKQKPLLKNHALSPSLLYTEKAYLGSSHWAQRVTNLTSIHEDIGSILGLTQWVIGSGIAMSCGIGHRHSFDP